MSVPAPQVAFYGDDFTGATDALGTAARAGLRSLLFLGVPTAAQRERAGALDCLGIAGAARSMPPAEMAAELAPVAQFFRGLGAKLLHYKTCSTFDSAPQVGNIAVAIEALRAAGVQRTAAIVGGQPSLGRYCAFGNLFASAGGAEVFRIDRHPTMSRHPVTPMGEADLRVHLAAQGLADIALVPFTSYGAAHLWRDSSQALLFDALTPDHLRTIGQVLRDRATAEPLLAVGPSSVLQAWAGEGNAQPTQVAPTQGPVFILAGSLSPVTAQQVQAADSFEKAWLDPAQLVHSDDYLQTAARDLAARLAQGRSVIACTVAPDAARTSDVSARAIAQAGGVLLAHVLAATPVRRVGIAGGDTSSHAVQALDAWGLSYVAPLAPGASLCRLHSDFASLDGLELLLKGGQMGPVGLFERLLHGS